jgi:hypothetical protein
VTMVRRSASLLRAQSVKSAQSADEKLEWSLAKP